MLPVSAPPRRLAGLLLAVLPLLSFQTAFLCSAAPTSSLLDADLPQHALAQTQTPEAAGRGSHHPAAPYAYHALPPLRDQAALVDGWTSERRARIPALLRRYGVDAWLLSMREYAEDTLFWPLKAREQFSARRRTTVLFLAENISAATGGDENKIPGASSGAQRQRMFTWVDNTPALWDEVRTVLEKYQPRSIAVNAHPDVAFASGLHAGELDALREGLGSGWADKFVVEPMLAIEVVGRSVKSRLPWYKKMMETAWAVIDDAFSEKVIVPGVTTTEDVEWWMREKLQAWNYTTWFHPDVTVLDETFPIASSQRNDVLSGKASYARTINYGDLLHVDFGLTALGLNTDTQHLGYVLHPGETEDDVPKGLLAGLNKGNRLQDIVRSNLRPRHTGNEALAASLAQMHDEGLAGKIYCHPIGDWGHSGGSLVGMTNLQRGVPVLGDLPVVDGGYYSIELLAEHFVPERNATLKFPLEEDVYWDENRGTWEWMFGRQESFHLVKPRAPANEIGDDL